jgi:hypothetical protein
LAGCVPATIASMISGARKASGSLMPLVMRDLLHRGPQTYGIMLDALAWVR